MSYSLLYLLISILLFVYLAQRLAVRKGLNPVFWGIMASLFGPLVFPFMLLAKPGNPQPKS